jgi:hypothetical protein
MTTPTAGRWCCRTVELAAWLLPAEYRQRYALEFVAESYGMSHPQQVRHSVQVLSRAWALRAALDADGLAPIQEKARRSTEVGCCVTLVGTGGSSIANPDLGGEDAMFELCRRCGRERRAYEPPPPGAIVGG